MASSMDMRVSQVMVESGGMGDTLRDARDWVIVSIEGASVWDVEREESAK